MYSQYHHFQFFEKNMIEVLKTINSNWNKILSYTGDLKKRALKSFTFYSSYEWSYKIDY